MDSSIFLVGVQHPSNILEKMMAMYFVKVKRLGIRYVISYSAVHILAKIPRQQLTRRSSPLTSHTGSVPFFSFFSTPHSDSILAFLSLSNLSLLRSNLGFQQFLQLGGDFVAHLARRSRAPNVLGCYPHLEDQLDRGFDLLCLLFHAEAVSE
jgi:hypothetical protein